MNILTLFLQTSSSDQTNDTFALTKWSVVQGYKFWQGRIWRKTWKKGKEKGGKEEKKEKSDKTHVKITLWRLNTAKKSTKTGKNFRGRGGIFLAGQNIYPSDFVITNKKKLFIKQN